MPDCLIFDFGYVDCRSKSNYSKCLLTNVKIPYVRIHVFYSINTRFQNTQNQSINALGVY